MTKLSEIIDLQWLMQLLDDNMPIEELIKELENKGFELGQSIDSIEALEGKVIHKGDLRLLPACPMVPLLNKIKESHGGSYPDSFPKIVNAYKEKNPTSAGILHPLCIVHQTIRKTFGMAHDEYFEQVACRSTSSGEIVTSEAGLVMSGLSDAEARDMVKEAACLYFVGT